MGIVKRMKLNLLVTMSACFSVTAVCAQSTLNVRMDRDLTTTEYSTKYEPASSMVLNHIMESLVAYDGNLEVVPSLAESWTISNDGRKYNFSLRKDVTFHNGERLTAEIVKWNLERFLNNPEDWGAQCRSRLDGGFEEFIKPSYVISISVDGPHNVVVELQSPSGLFLNHLADQHCIYGIVHPDSVDGEGIWKAPIGTGPYRLASWNKGESVILRRFDDYRAMEGPRSGLTGSKVALIETIEFKIIPNIADARHMLVSGEIDVMPDADEITIESFRSSSKVKLIEQQTPETLLLILQTRHPLMQNPKIRLAIAHAVNRSEIIENAIGGSARANPSLVADSSPFFGKEQRKAPVYNPGLARRLLDEAGYAGQTVEIMTSKDVYPINFRTANILKNQLESAGFTVSINDVGWETQYASYGTPDFQLMPMIFSARNDPSLMYSAIVGQKGDHPWYLWEDQYTDMLVGSVAMELDPEKKQKLLDEIHQKMIEWNPVIVMGNYPTIDIVNDDIDDYEGWALGLPRFWGVTK